MKQILLFLLFLTFSVTGFSQRTVTNDGEFDNCFDAPSGSVFTETAAGSNVFVGPTVTPLGTFSIEIEGNGNWSYTLGQQFVGVAPALGGPYTPDLRDPNNDCTGSFGATVRDANGDVITQPALTQVGDFTGAGCPASTDGTVFNPDDATGDSYTSSTDPNITLVRTNSGPVQAFDLIVGGTSEARGPVSPGTATPEGEYIALATSVCEGSVMISSNPQPLPIELTTFEGFATKGGIELQWETASELNNDRFEVETSMTGESFEYLGTVSGSGTSDDFSNYTFDVLDAQRGTNYFRIKQVDFDGTFSYSEVIGVDFGGNAGVGNIFPNPATGFANLDYVSAAGNEVSISIFDVSGKRVSVQMLETTTGVNRLQFDLSELVNGVYTVQVQDGEATTQQKLMIGK